MRNTHRLAEAWGKVSEKTRKIVTATVLASFVLSATQIHTAFAVAPTSSAASFAFDLSGAFSNAGNIQQGPGAFGNGSLQDYPEGSCIPTLFQVKNTSNASANIAVSPVYDYYNGVIGFDDLETLSTTLSGSTLKTGADNLNDFGTTGSSLTAATSFSTTANGTVAATVSGPYAGNNDTTTATTATDAFRHYNVQLSSVGAGVTVNVLFCGRLGVDASEYNGASLSIRTAQYGAENIGIQVNQLLVLPSITLTKVVASGAALPEDFSFTVSPAINNQSVYSIPTGQSTVVIDNVMPDGAFTITESGPSGYNFVSGTGTSCTFSQSGTASATVAAGKPATNASCTYTNEETHVPTATLTVTKVVVNDDAGTSVVSDFGLSVGNTAVTSGQAASFAPGTYAVTESNASGYTATYSGDCDANGNVTLADGDSKTCTITNNDIHIPTATLTVTKVVVNDDDGTSQVSDFPLYVGNTAVTSGQAATFAPGTYAVTESTQGGYTATYSGDCDTQGNVTLADGDSKTCTITNNDITPPPPPEDPTATLTVTKVVVNDDAGTATVSSFPLFVGNTSVSSGVAATFAPGTYVVTESNQGGYTATYSGDCDANGNVTLAADENKTCTITNDDVHVPEATLTVTKVVVNDDNGTSQVSDFPLSVDQTAVTSGVAATFAPGTYAVTESNATGYTATYSGDCDANGNVTLADGDSKTCTITNNDITPPPAPQATLTVVKVVVNNDNGTSQVSDFPLSVGNTSVTSGVAATFAPGTYAVTESNATGYTATYSGDCDANGNVTLADADNKTCTITNNDIHVAQATLTVTKIVVNDDETGDAQVSDFPLFVGQTSVTSGAANTFAPGSYVVSETNQGGYAATFSGDCDAQGNVTLADGDSKTCTITNNDIAPTTATLTVNVVVDNSNGGSLSANEVGIWVDQTQQEEGPLASLFSSLANAIIAPVHAAVVATLSNGVPTTLNPGTYTVMHSSHSGYTAAITGNCSSSGAVTLLPQSNQTCTITLSTPPAPPSPPGGGGGGGSGPSTSITVVTVVINDDGGTMTPSSAVMNVQSGTTTTSTFVGTSAPGQTVGLPAGSYAVDGTSLSGYTKSSSTTCTGTAGVGSGIVCTITYDDVPSAPVPPPPAVLGATDEQPPAPQVLGATTELPRTGTPVALLLAPFAALFVAVRRNKR